MMRQSIAALAIMIVVQACGAAGRGSTSTIGVPAPDFTAKHVDDTPFQLSSLRGRVVVLEIWAAWCEGCEKELPVLDALASRIHSLGAAVVSVSIDEQPRKALELLRARNWTMTVLYEQSGRVGDAYQPSKMPAVFVIDHDGVIRDVRFSLKPGDVAAIEARVTALAEANQSR